MATLNPLPSLIRASAHDAANKRMCAAGRSKWTRGDFNHAVAVQEKLICTCYGKPDDDKNSRLPFLRFSIAEQMQQEGLFCLASDFAEVSEIIDELIAA